MSSFTYSSNGGIYYGKRRSSAAKAFTDPSLTSARCSHHSDEGHPGILLIGKVLQMNGMLTHPTAIRRSLGVPFSALSTNGISEPSMGTLGTRAFPKRAVGLAMSTTPIRLMTVQIYE